MNWNNEFKWSNRTQAIVAGALWVIFAMALVYPFAIKRLTNSPGWPRAVLMGGWASPAMRQSVKARFFRSVEPSDVPLLVELIDKSPKQERPSWAALLQRSKGKQTIEAFINLAHDDDELVRSTALRYLSANGDATAAPILLEALSHPDTEHAVPVAAEGLGRLGEARAIGPMIEILKRFEAPDALTDTELLLGRTASKIAGQSFDFRENCRVVRMCLDSEYHAIWGKYDSAHRAEMTKELNALALGRRRKECDNRGPVKARKQLILWWAKK